MTFLYTNHGFTYTQVGMVINLENSMFAIWRHYILTQNIKRIFFEDNTKKKKYNTNTSMYGTLTISLPYCKGKFHYIN